MAPPGSRVQPAFEIEPLEMSPSPEITTRGDGDAVKHVNRLSEAILGGFWGL